MNKIFLVLVCFIWNTLYAEDTKSYINIHSNVKNTIIYLDGVKIGTAPIEQYEVSPEKDIRLIALVDTNYYTQNIEKTIVVNTNTIPTIDLKFTKAKTKIFLVGDDAELYINDHFVKKLNDDNRLITIDAGKNIKIRLEKSDADITLYENVYANDKKTIHYTMIKKPLDVRLYTVSIDNLMWEDTKDAANTNINWKDAKSYCEDLQYGNYDDFRLPTIDELNYLYENKDKIYNGFGSPFYWSSMTYKDYYKIWDYSQVKNFEDGENKKSIKEFDKGKVRCVREIYKKSIEVINDVTVEEIEDYTKDEADDESE